MFKSTLQAAIVTTFAAILFLAGAPSLFADNDALTCQMILHDTATQAPKQTDTGFSMSLNKQNGVANCSDGRLLQVQMMLTGLQRLGQKQITGFGVISFESGDTVTLQIRGTETTDTDAQADSTRITSLDYEIIAGSGKYQNSTGTAVSRSVEGSWSDTRLFDLTMVIHQ